VAIVPALATALACGLVLSDCGSGTPSASTASTSTSTVTTAPGPALPGVGQSVALTDAALPVQSCPTTYGVAQPTPTSLPATLTVSVPIAVADGLAVFSDPQGFLQVVGPKGWSCRGLVGADGSAALVLTPAGQLPGPSFDTEFWHVGSSSTQQAIAAYESGASPVSAAQAACSLLLNAATATQSYGLPCQAVPKGERTSALDGEAAFDDPPGVAGNGAPSGGTNAARGVVLYSTSPGVIGAYKLTCALPTSQLSVCAASGDAFVARYGHQVFHH